MSSSSNIELSGTLFVTKSVKLPITRGGGSDIDHNATLGTIRCANPGFVADRQLWRTVDRTAVASAHLETESFGDFDSSHAWVASVERSPVRMDCERSGIWFDRSGRAFRPLGSLGHGLALVATVKDPNGKPPSQYGFPVVFDLRARAPSAMIIPGALFWRVRIWANQMTSIEETNAVDAILAFLDRIDLVSSRHGRLELQRRLERIDPELSRPLSGNDPSYVPLLKAQAKDNDFGQDRELVRALRTKP